MKKKIAIISMTLLVGGLLYFTSIRNSKAYEYGPPLGCTNSPGDGASCAYAGCHTSYALQSPKPWISSNVPLAGYTPGSTYTFTARAIYMGRQAFGFQISPQNSAGKTLGTLIVTNATTTQTGTYSTTTWIEQTSNGYLATDSMVWSFNWKAPVKGTGNVTFYGCFNCANNDHSSGGDYIYPATLLVKENTTADIDNISAAASSLNVYPNPAKENITLSYTLNEEANTEINLYSIDGRMISKLASGMVTSGEHIQDLKLPLEIKPGIYLIQLIANGQSTVQRIVAE